ncbi:MAG: O-antigen ligase family protein [Actinomycetota bacterium]
MAGVVVLVAAGALVFDPGGWQSFGPSKWVVTTTAAWGLLTVTIRRGVTLHLPSLIGWAALLAWASVTSLPALDPVSAWLGTPDRRLGTFALLTMAAAFVAGQGVEDEAGRRVLGRSAAVALAGMGIYGAAEALGAAPVELTTTTARLGSVFGSAAYLGAALCLMAPLSAGLACDGREARAWRMAGALGTGAAAFLLVGSATGAAVVGLGAAAVLVAARLRLPHRRALGGVAVLIAVALAALPAVRQSVGEDLESRWAEWRTAGSVLAAHPLTGTGLEGYRVAFPRHVDADYVRAFGRSTVTDRAHSGPLDMGVAMGVPGMAAWLVAAGWLALRAWRSLGSSSPLVAGMAAGVVALVTQELLLFPTREVGVAGWLVAGMLVASRPMPQTVWWRSRLGSRLALAVAVVTLVAGLADVAADHLAASARRDLDPGAAEQAAAFRPDSFRYPLLAADISLRSGRPAQALSHVEAALRISQADPALRLARARALAALVANGAEDPAAAAADVGEIVEDDPNHPALRIIHGELLAAAGAAAEAERSFLAAAHLAPRSAQPELRLASLYAAIGEDRLAAEALARARSKEPDHPRIPALAQEIENA